MNEEQAAQNLARELNNLHRHFMAKASKNVVTVVWDWLNASAYGILKVTERDRKYKYTVTLHPNNKYSVTHTDNKMSLNAGIGGIKISGGTSTIHGLNTQKSGEIHLFGKDNKTGKTGALRVYTFDTQEIAEPVKRILTDMGYKRKLF